MFNRKGDAMRNYWNNGRWAMTVIYDCDTHEYTATINTENNGFIDFWEGSDYNTLAKRIMEATGIVIIKRNNMIFEKLSAHERIATIDASGGKIGDCRVTLNEIRAGWKPNLPNNVAIAFC